MSQDTMVSIILLLCFLLVTTIAGAHYKQWKDREFQQKLISPVPMEKVYAEEKKIDPYIKAKTDLEIIDGLKHRDVTIWVYGLESTWGVEDGCERQGRYNGFGYRQNVNEWVCYDSFDEVAKLVDRWFDIQLRIKTLPQALCYYNTGKPTNTCEYYRKFLSLKK